MFSIHTHPLFSNFGVNSAVDLQERLRISLVESICERSHSSSLGPGSSQFKKKPYREDTWMEKDGTMERTRGQEGRMVQQETTAYIWKSAKCPGQVPY